MRIKRVLFGVLAVATLGLASCGKEKELKGFDIDLAKVVSKELGVEVKFQEIVWEYKELELSSKNIDLIWNGLTITDERKENLELSIPYLENRQVIVSKDKNIDLNKNLIVSFEAGSAGEDLFESDSNFSSMTRVETSAQVDALTEVLSNNSDIAIIDATMAGYYINSNTSYSSLNIIDYNTESEFYGIAARKGEKALINKINAIITRLYDNKIREVADKYGLTDFLVTPESYDTTSNDDSLDYIINKKSLVIGYTIFAPIAFEE